MGKLIGGLERSFDYWFRINEAYKMDRAKSIADVTTEAFDWAGSVMITGAEAFVVINHVIPQFREGNYRNAAWCACFVGGMELVKYVYQKYLHLLKAT